MSIVFTPKIAVSYASLKTEAPIVVAPVPAKRAYVSNPWSEDEIDKMVQLRARGVSYRDIGKLLHRNRESCSNTISRLDLRDRYMLIRAELISEVMA